MAAQDKRPLRFKRFLSLIDEVFRQRVTSRSVCSEVRTFWTFVSSNTLTYLGDVTNPLRN